MWWTRRLTVPRDTETEDIYREMKCHRVEVVFTRWTLETTLVLINGKRFHFIAFLKPLRTDFTEKGFQYYTELYEYVLI